MFVAQIHGRLTRSEEDLEDLLTSNGFGIWRYLPDQLGLLRFLQTARRLDGEPFVVPGKVEVIDLQFWPWIQERGAKGVEPDVLIEMVLSDQQEYLVLIEVKHLSGKSSLPDKHSLPNDQLAREMHNLRKMAGRKGIERYALLYVTADTLMPRSDVGESIAELGAKTNDGGDDRFYWTSWRSFPKILSEVKGACEKYSSAMLSDLETILRRMGLTFFEGISSEGWTWGEIAWVFERTQASIAFEWGSISIVNYAFEEGG